MFRKNCFLLSLALSVVIRLYWNIQGTESDGLLTLLLSALWMAFLLPVAWQVRLIETHVFSFDPWTGTGHWLVTTVAMILAGWLVWFFPWGRVERLFGMFDAVSEGKTRRLPSPVRGAAYALDAINKRLFGRQKTGGWA